MLSLLSLVLVVSLVVSLARSSVPEDLFAFPKHRVSFLNALPVANNTAQRWLADGVPGGEAEFLALAPPDNTSSVAHQHPTDNAPAPPDALELLRLAPTKSYLCLLPPPPTLPPPPQDDQTPPTPSHSWSLLQPLSGSCLYHRQGWFTYSYCHNLHVRQFRELPVQFPYPPGPRIVDEDPDWESFTLGRSSASRTVDGELTVNDDLALANNLELARQAAGQRYLVQRWTDGTMCQKTGRPREVQVQFHCSMTTTDTIMFIKETRTCEYVLVIHTPRLCSEPGFKSRFDQMPDAPLRCRQILPSVNDADPAAPGAPHPFPRTPHRRPSPPPPVAHPAPDKPRTTIDRAGNTAKLLRKAIESFLGRADADGNGDGDDLQVFGIHPGDEDGEFYIDLDIDSSLETSDDSAQPDDAAPAAAKGTALEAALRAAGYEIKGRKKTASPPDDTAQQRKKTKKQQQKPQTEPRDEL